MKFIRLFIFIFIAAVFFVVAPKKIFACTVFSISDPTNSTYLADPCKPYYSFNASSTLDTTVTDPYLVTVSIDTVGNTVDALQGVVSYDSTYLTISNLSTAGSVCTLWSPANSSPPGKDITSTTPYVSGEKIVFTCGISGGYNGASGFVFSFKVTPTTSGSTFLDFDTSTTDTKFIRVGTNLFIGAMYSHAFSIDGATVITPTPTPTSTASATITPTPTITPIITAVPTATVAATPTPIVTTTTLFNDVQVTDVTDNLAGSSSTSSISTSTNSELDVIAQDNALPPPPLDLTPRPAATPFNPTINTAGDIPEQNVLDQLSDTSGEVLSVKGLRDLLIPGKTKADRTVVMINFISLILFLIVLMVILWKMNINTRVAKIKSQHIHELVEGELAALESKMQIIKSKEGQEEFEGEFEQTINHIMDSFKTKKKTKK